MSSRCTLESPVLGFLWQGFCLFVLLLASDLVRKTAAVASPPSPNASRYSIDWVLQGDTSFDYTHPGTYMGREQINRLKFYQPTSNITSAALTELMGFVNEDLNKPPQALEEVMVLGKFGPQEWERLKKSSPDRAAEWQRQKEQEAKLIAEGVIAGHNNFTGDAVRSYKHTMAYLITQDAIYAEKAIEILSSWSKTCKKVGPSTRNGPLESGWALATLAMTAEILKYMYHGWDASGVEPLFVRFVDTVLLPQLAVRDDASGMARDETNWGTTITQARLQYAIFTQNNTLFKLALRKSLDLYKTVIIMDNGQAAETVSRDVVHAQFGLGGLAGISEIFWHQGIDIFSQRSHILRTSYEYHASILMGKMPKDVEHVKLFWVKYVPANWWIVYHHFVYREEDKQGKKLLPCQNPMPMTRELLIKRNGAEAFQFNWGLGTLSHFATSGRTSI